MSLDHKAATRPLVWIALVATLGLVCWQWLQEDSNPEDVVSRPVRSSQVSVVEQVSSQQLSVHTDSPEDSAATVISSPAPHTYFTRALAEAKLSHALFVAHEWLPPPPKPQPPPPPQAPPLPYSYVGSMQDVPDGDTVILMQQKKVVLSRLGSQINTQWRLDREDTQAVYFTYLPLNKPVMLSKTKTASASQRQASANAQNNYSEEMFNQ